MTQEMPKRSNVLQIWLVLLTLMQAVQTGLIVHVLTLVHSRI